MSREYKGLREAGKVNNTKTPRVNKIRIWGRRKNWSNYRKATVMTYTSAEKRTIQTLGDTEVLSSQTGILSGGMEQHQHGQGRVLKRLREDRGGT